MAAVELLAGRIVLKNLELCRIRTRDPRLGIRGESYAANGMTILERVTKSLMAVEGG